MNESGRFDSWALPAGTLLDDGNIVIQSVLGMGGFGITYKALDRKYGTTIALKEFLPRSMIYARDTDGVRIYAEKQALYDKCLAQFKRESKMLSRISHPNIVRVLFEVEGYGTHYYGMELLAGQNLADYVNRRGQPLTLHEALDLLNPIMDALETLHKSGILHRDISPANIFLRQRGAGEGPSPCLIDFGAAFSAQKDFTHTFPKVRTRGYSPLEQNWDGQYQGTWTDVYAFCATLYFALTRTVPLPADERGVGDMNDRLRPASEYNRTVTKAVSDVLRHGMALEPQHRLQSMGELKRALGQAMAHEPAVDSLTPERDMQIPAHDNATASPADEGDSGLGLMRRLRTWLAGLMQRVKGGLNGGQSVISKPTIDVTQPVLGFLCMRGYRAGEMFPAEGRMLFGRDESADVRLPDECSTVSHRHCVVYHRDGQWYVTDMNSRNGTSLNGTRLIPGKPARLTIGDRLEVSSEVFLFDMLQPTSYTVANPGRNGRIVGKILRHE